MCAVPSDFACKVLERYIIIGKSSVFGCCGYDTATLSSHLKPERNRYASMVTNDVIIITDAYIPKSRT
jgi:hypothetical protein